MDFKEAIYQNYVLHHTQQLYGTGSLARLHRQFPVWRHYFGDLLPADRAAAILDIGCGDGSFVFFLQSLGYARAEGIDLSAQQIEAGQALGILNLQVANLHPFLSGKTEAFDCIIARDVMEHLTRQEVFDTLLSIRAALRPGGCFVMQSPNGEGLFYTSIFYGDFTHEIAFTQSSLSQVFRNTGFEQVKFRPTGPVPHSIFSSVRWMIWNLIVLKTKILKMVETGSWGGIFTQNIIAKATRD